MSPFTVVCFINSSKHFFTQNELTHSFSYKLINTHYLHLYNFAQDKDVYTYFSRNYPGFLNSPKQKNGNDIGILSSFVNSDQDEDT